MSLGSFSVLASATAALTLSTIFHTMLWPGNSQLPLYYGYGILSFRVGSLGSFKRTANICSGCLVDPIQSTGNQIRAALGQHQRMLWTHLLLVLLLQGLVQCSAYTSFIIIFSSYLKLFYTYLKYY